MYLYICLLFVLKDEAGFGICVLSYTRSIYFCLVCSVMIYMKDNLFLKQPISLFFVELKSIEICKRCLWSVWNFINIAWSTFQNFLLVFPEYIYVKQLYFRMLDSFDGIRTLEKLWEIRFCVLLHNQSFRRHHMMMSFETTYTYKTSSRISNTKQNMFLTDKDNIYRVLFLYLCFDKEPFMVCWNALVTWYMSSKDMLNSWTTNISFTARLKNLWKFFVKGSVN